jgi:hypothetical protein
MGENFYTLNFNFQFGKKKKTIAQWATISVVLGSLVVGISKCTHIPEETIWDLIDEIQREINIDPPELNDYIINTPELLNRRVHRDVDRAIYNYQRLTGDDGQVRLPAPRFSEKPVNLDECHTDACKALGGEIRLCAPWIPDCPLTNQEVPGTLKKSEGEPINPLK